MTETSDAYTELADIVARLVDSPYSGFYRELYGVPKGSRAAINSLKDWDLVPTFTKDAIIERPVREYTFVPHAKVEAVYYTSGTSGKPPAFISWLAYAGSYDYRKAFYNFPGAVLTSIKAQHRSDAFLKDMGSRSLSINFDGKNLAACIALAKAAGVDSLGVHTFTLQAIGEEMKKTGINLDIKLIDFVGETCSLALYSYMRATFPNAKIISYFGLSEAESAPGYPCRALSDSEPYPVYHAHPDFHFDIVDSDTGAPLEPAAGIEGDVLITDLIKERAFAMLKYRPGDTVRVIDTACKEHGLWTFTVLGKTASDFMLVPGGQLRADEIERVLHTMPGDVTDHFEMHRYDGGTSERPMLEVVLHVQSKNLAVDYKALSERIAKELRVSPSHTYEDGVKDGRYLPLRCVPLEAKLVAEKKHKRMFKH